MAIALNLVAALLGGDVESRSLLTELGFAKAYLPHPAAIFLEWEVGESSLHWAFQRAFGF